MNKFHGEQNSKFIFKKTGSMLQIFPFVWGPTRLSTGLLFCYWYLFHNSKSLLLNRENWRLRNWSWFNSPVTGIGFVTVLFPSCYLETFVCSHVEFWLCFQMATVTRILSSISVEYYISSMVSNKTPSSSWSYLNINMSFKPINVYKHFWNDNCLRFWFGSVNIYRVLRSHQTL